MLYVCALEDLNKTIEKTGATSLITLIADDPPILRPPTIEENYHLYLKFNDITSPQTGLVLPNEKHIRKLLDFIDKWDQNCTLLIHCYAGISRSTAAAFISACYLNPNQDEYEIALKLRTASPSATPNSLMIQIADKMLNRQGRMKNAITKIGSGLTVYKGAPFELKI